MTDVPCIDCGGSRGPEATPSYWFGGVCIAFCRACEQGDIDHRTAVVERLLRQRERERQAVRR